MVLETTECIKINNNGKSYTDCMEFSLLRFIQLLLFDLDEINESNKSLYPKIKYHDDISEFIKKYPIIYKNSEYYLEDDIGIKQRNDWATLVSDKDFLDYYRNDNSELFTSIINILKFLNGFFDLELDYNNITESLEIISNKFSLPNKKITINLEEVKNNENLMKLSDINKYISRPQTKSEIDKFKIDSNKYNVVSKKSYINININDIEYEWMLFEMYFKDCTLFENKYITGHSVIIKK